MGIVDADSADDNATGRGGAVDASIERWRPCLFGLFFGPLVDGSRRGGGRVSDGVEPVLDGLCK